MICSECGKKMVTRRENYKYDMSGLSGITLVGVNVSRCAACGNYEVEIPYMEALHRKIALAVIARSGRLAADEIVYLRKWLGWSGADFARYMGATPETVSRWEHGSTPMGSTAERLLRLMVATRQPVDAYGLEHLKSITGKTAAKLRVALKSGKAGGWEDAA